MFVKYFSKKTIFVLQNTKAAYPIQHLLNMKKNPVVRSVKLHCCCPIPQLTAAIKKRNMELGLKDLIEEVKRHSTEEINRVLA